MRFHSIAAAREAYLSKKIDKFEYDAILLRKALEQMSAAMEASRSTEPAAAPSPPPLPVAVKRGR